MDNVRFFPLQYTPKSSIRKRQSLHHRRRRFKIQPFFLKTRRKRAAATEFLSDVGTERTVKGENGEYLVRTNEDGYTITKKGEEGKQLDLVYNEENRTWSAVSEGESYELITMNEDGTVTVKMQDGTPLTVTPDMQGLSTARAASGQSLFFAAR